MPRDELSHLYSVVRHLNPAYSNSLNGVRITTAELRNQATLQKYVFSGYKYIRRLNYNYHHIMREPTNGCIVELTKVQEVGSILIESSMARKLINRISYF